MDVLHIMKADHERLKSRLSEFLAAESVSNRRKLFPDLEKELTVHSTIEEGYLYPEVSGLFADADVLLDICAANHILLTRNLQAIGKLIGKPQAEQSGLQKKIDELNQLVGKHIALQEQSLMPKIRQLIATQDREDLGQVLLDKRAEAEAGIDISVPKAVDVPMQAKGTKNQKPLKVAPKRKRA